MADYSAEVAAAREMIEEAGSVITFARGQQGVLDPLTDERTEAADLTTASYAVKIPPGVMDKIPTTRQEREGGRFLVSALAMSFKPKAGDSMEFANATWSVLSCEPLDPDGTPIIFTVDAEK